MTRRTGSGDRVRDGTRIPDIGMETGRLGMGESVEVEWHQIAEKFQNWRWHQRSCQTAGTAHKSLAKGSLATEPGEGRCHRDQGSSSAVDHLVAPGMERGQQKLEWRHRNRTFLL